MIFLNTQPPPMYTVVNVDASNLALHPQAVCFINPKHPTYRLKVAWMTKRFNEGLRIKLVYASGENRPVGFIEYVPGEKCWRGVSAPGHLFIQCIWTNSLKHKRKGIGSMLIENCYRDAQENGFSGVATTTSLKPGSATSSEKENCCNPSGLPACSKYKRCHATHNSP